MTQGAPSSGAEARACPFVAFEEDRDRRSEVPDPRNRCYAEPTPQPRDLAHQAAFCLAPAFPSCPTFLAWAARAAAAPAVDARPASTPLAAPTEDGASDEAAGSDEPSPVAGVAARSAAALGGPPVEVRAADAGTDAPEEGQPDAGTDAPEEGQPEAEGAPADASSTMYDQRAAGGRRPARGLEATEWVPTTAWPDQPPEERPWPEADADPPDWPASDEGPDAGVAGASRGAASGDGKDGQPGPVPRPAESTAPIPAARLAAIPTRRRRAQVPTLRAIGSGEWVGGLPPNQEPRAGRRLPGDVRTRTAAAAGMLAALILAVFLLPSLLPGGGAAGPDASPTADPAASAGAGASPSAGASLAPGASPGSSAGSAPDGSARPQPTPQVYRIKRGDTLSGLAARFKVSMDLIVCVNGIRDPDLLTPGQELVIPRRNQRCPPRPTRVPDEAAPSPSDEASGADAAASAATSPEAPTADVAGDAASPPPSPDAIAEPGRSS